MGAFSTLLSNTGQDGTLSPGTQGLLALSQALLKAGEPSRIPISNAQALGGAVGSYTPSIATAQSRANIANALNSGDLKGAVQAMVMSPDPQLQNLGLSSSMNMLTPEYQINAAVMKNMLGDLNNSQGGAGAGTNATGGTTDVSSSIRSGKVTGSQMGDLAFYANDKKGYFEALAKANMPTDLQKNVSSPSTQPYVAKDTLVNTAGGYVPASSLLPGGGGQPQHASAPQPQAHAPGGATSPSAAGLPDQTVAQMNDPVYQKQREGLIGGDQKYLNETLLPAKDAAKQAIGNVDTIQQAAAIANKSDLTRTGPTAPARIEFVKHLNDFLASTGGEPLKPNEIANADAINKVGIRLTANMTKMLGSREAAQIFQKISEANPSWYMQPQTLNLVSNLIKQDSQYAIDKYMAGYKSALKPGGLAQDGVNQFESENPPSKYVRQGFKDSGMIGIDSPTDPNFKLLPKGGKFYDMNPASPYYGQQLTKQ